MSGFGHYNQTIAELEKEIAICGVVLGLDWTNEAQVRTLVNESLHCTSGQCQAMLHAPDERTKARGKLFALLDLLLDVMRQEAETGAQPMGNGSGLWQALNRAFIESYDRLDGNGHSSA